jgi:EmrB/QacA subfamily drug resistance transporter
MTSTVDDAGRTQAPDHGHRHLGIALAIICIAQLMVVLDATIANIAIPYISEDLDFTAANRSWIITGYTLAFGGLLLLGGRAGDLLGRRRVFMFGLVVFAVASLLGGIAWNQETLLASRALQGLGAAVASPTALALITTTFPAGPARNRAFAVYAAMSGAGAAVGLILGGWLTEHSWRWTFLINVPIGIAAAALAPIFLGESKPHRGNFDFAGAITGTLGLVALVYGFTRAAETSWDDSWTILGLVAGVALLALFLVIERVQRDPILPFRILADRTRGISFLVMLLVPAAMFAMFFFLSQIVQNGLGWSPLETGFAFLPFTVGIVFSAGLSSALATRVDPRWLAGTGATLAAIGLFGFSFIGYDDVVSAGPPTFGLGIEASYVTDLLPWILVMSFGMGMVFVPLTITAVHGVGAQDSGIGSGVLNAMQQVGGSLGLAILSTVAVSSAKDKATEIGASAQAAAPPGTPAPTGGELQQFQEAISPVAFTHGSTVAFVVGAGMIAVAAVITLLFLNVRHEELAADGAPEGVHVG